MACPWWDKDKHSTGSYHEKNEGEYKVSTKAENQKGKEVQKQPEKTYERGYEAGYECKSKKDYESGYNVRYECRSKEGCEEHGYKIVYERRSENGYVYEREFEKGYAYERGFEKGYLIDHGHESSRGSESQRDYDYGYNDFEAKNPDVMAFQWRNFDKLSIGLHPENYKGKSHEEHKGGNHNWEMKDETQLGKGYDSGYQLDHDSRKSEYSETDDGGDCSHDHDSRKSEYSETDDGDDSSHNSEYSQSDNGDNNSGSSEYIESDHCDDSNSYGEYEEYDDDSCEYDSDGIGGWSDSD